MPLDTSESEPPPPIQLQMHRVTPPLLEVTPFITRFHVNNRTSLWAKGSSPNGRPPDRLPSQLPEPGDLNLSLSLDTLLGYGGSSQVFSIKLGEDTRPFSSRIPPLAVKVIRPTRIISLVREAFIYEELESIQAIAVPRCYGLLKGRISPGFSLIDARVKFVNSDEYYEHNDDAIVPLPEGAPDNYVFEGRPPLKKYIRRSHYDPDEIYILVFEKVGTSLSKFQTRL